MKSLNIWWSESIWIEDTIASYRKKYGIDNWGEVDLQWIRAIEYVWLLYWLILSYTDNYAESTHTEYTITPEGKTLLFCCIDLWKEWCSWSDFQDKVHNCYNLISSYAPYFDLILWFNYGDKWWLRMDWEKITLLSQEELDNYDDIYTWWISLYDQLRKIAKQKKEQKFDFSSYKNEIYWLGIQYYEDYNSKIAKKNLDTIYSNLSPLFESIFLWELLSPAQSNHSSSFIYDPDRLHQSYEDRIQKDEERE